MLARWVGKRESLGGATDAVAAVGPVREWLADYLFAFPTHPYPEAQAP